MPFADLMIAGVELMVLGMGIVFFFLVLLVFTLKGMSRLACRYATPDTTDVEPARENGSQDGEIVAVISAAINRYRHQHGKKTLP